MHIDFFMSFNLIMFLLIILILYKFEESFFMLLISFEFILIYSMMMMMIINSSESNDYLFIYLLVMGVSDSVIGITLMISLIFEKGNQSLKILNLNM